LHSSLGHFTSKTKFADCFLRQVTDKISLTTGDIFLIYAYSCLDHKDNWNLMRGQKTESGRRRRLMGYPLRVRVVGKKTILSSSASSQLQIHESTVQLKWRPVRQEADRLMFHHMIINILWLQKQSRNLVDKDALPKARHKTMEKNRNHNPGKLIAWAQTRSATKGSKQAGPYCVLEFILTLHNCNHKLV